MIKVKLRQKPISGNRQSLYLDFYPAIPHPKTGKPTRRQFLGYHIFGSLDKDGKLDKAINRKLNPFDQTHDSNQFRIAEQLRQNKENDLNKPEIYSGFEKEQLKIKERGGQNFVDYFKRLAEKRKASNHDNWISAFKYLNSFTKGNLKFADLDEKFCNEFKDYLLSAKSNRSSKTSLARNSAVSYFNKLKAALKQAYKDGYLRIDLNPKIECIENQDIIKQTLTIEELNLLARTDCKSPFLKNIVLFSALTGMPFKEMQNLKWNQIEISDSFGIRIKMIRQKTLKAYFINISPQAYSLLGDRKEYNDNVFEGLNDRDRYYLFPLWLAEAGIKKSMTFHDLRHTYGCLQIDAGTDIYTLQGNMGHSTPRQSMMYGKISDLRKRDAAEKITLDLPK